jgi:Low molecular weight phosphotyrosine protein phosphatase
MNEPHASITAAGTEETAAQTGPVAAQQWRFPGPRVRLLFLCRNNSARSPMAEALTRHLTRGQVDVFSAGSHPAPQIHPEAIRAIARLGADIQQYHPKPVANFEGQTFDRVILLQARDEEGGPAFPGALPHGTSAFDILMDTAFCS